MTDRWQIDSDRTPPRPILTGKQRRYIRTGETAPYGEGKYEADITGKAAQLPQRIQDLVDDIALFYEGGYLDSGTEHQLTATALTLRTQSLDWERHTKYVSIDEEAAYSVEVGRLIDALGIETDPADLLWGVLLGYLDASTDELPSNADPVGEVIAELQHRSEERLINVGRRQHIESDDWLTELREEVISALTAHGVTPTWPIIDPVVRHYLGDEDYIAALEGDRSMDSPASVETVVDQLISETALMAVDSLHTDLTNDVREVEDAEKFGTVVSDVLWEFDLRHPIGRGEFSSDSYASVEMLTNILRQLSEEDGFGSWPQRPLTEEVSQNQWKPTTYGRLLCEATQDRGGDTAWVYEYVLGQSPATEEHALGPSSLDDAEIEWIAGEVSE